MIMKTHKRKIIIHHSRLIYFITAVVTLIGICGIISCLIVKCENTIVIVAMALFVFLGFLSFIQLWKTRIVLNDDFLEVHGFISKKIIDKSKLIKSTWEKGCGVS
jgi:hypothetical protein